MRARIWAVVAVSGLLATGCTSSPASPTVATSTTGGPSGSGAASPSPSTSGDPTDAGPGDGATPPAPGADAEWTQIAVPARVTLRGARTSIAEVLGDSGTLPALALGNTRTGAEPSTPVFWTRTKGGSWTPGTLDFPNTDDVYVGDAASGGTTTWMTGSTWTPGEVVTPWLKRSADRRSWTDVALPDDVTSRAFGIADVVADKTGAFLVGLDKDYRTVVVHVVGETVTSVDLPDGPGPVESVDGIAKIGSTVVVVAESSKDGDARGQVSFVSSDSGKTWKAHPAVLPAGVNANGLAAAAGRFVVTGSRHSGAATLPGAWTSTDGVKWTADSVDVSRGSSVLDYRYDHGFTAPSAASGRIVAGIWASGTQLAGVAERTRSGTWTFRGVTNSANPGGYPDVAPLSGGAIASARSDDNAVSLGSVSGGTYHHELSAGSGAGSSWSWTDFEAGEVPTISASRYRLTTYGNGGWAQTYPTTRIAVPATGSATKATDYPPSPGELTNTVTARADGAGEVLLASQFFSVNGDSSERLVGWHRTSATAEWKKVSGFSAQTVDSPYAVTHVPDGWIAVGSSRADFTIGTESVSAVWTSKDGLRWKRSAFTSDTKTGVDGVCALPSGEPLIVGYRGGDGEPYAPRAWVQRAGSWHQLPASALGTHTGYASDCISNGKETIVRGYASSEAITWHTTDAKTFTARPLSARGDDFGQIHPVTGGFAAAGSRNSGAYSDAVVWLSPDGITWRPIVIPTKVRASGSDLIETDGGLVVAVEAGGQLELWRVADVAGLLSAV